MATDRLEIYKKQYTARSLPWMICLILSLCTNFRAVISASVIVLWLFTACRLRSCILWIISNDYYTIHPVAPLDIILYHLTVLGFITMYNKMINIITFTGVRHWVAKVASTLCAVLSWHGCPGGTNCDQAAERRGGRRWGHVPRSPVDFERGPGHFSINYKIFERLVSCPHYDLGKSGETVLK